MRRGPKPQLIARLREFQWQRWLLNHGIQRTVDTEKLHFPKKHHIPNPPALTTCRASRNAALKKYKLAFGTSHVYADLPGGDILYISSWNDCLSLEGFFDCEPWLEEEPHPSTLWYGLSAPLMTELNEVTKVVLHASHLMCYQEAAYVDDEDGLPNRL